MKRAILVLLALLALLLFVSVSVAQNKPAMNNHQPVELTEDMTPPILLEVASPLYTDTARKKKIEGAVVLDIVVDTTGKVTEATVKKGLGFGLDENAIIAVKEWLYKPARDKNGNPIAVKMEVTADYVLRD